MQTRVNRRRIAIAVGGAVAICSAGTAITVADSSPSNQPPSAVRSVSVDQSEIAAWARANGLTGLSPASLRRIDE
jgi:hypothetical protein